MRNILLRHCSGEEKEDDDPKGDFLDSVDSIIFDYIRSEQRQALSEKELDEYYWKTFSSVINILLIGLKSEIRATDIPELSRSQGRLYSIRDLKTDWERGTINIPQEVLGAAGLSANSSVNELTNNQTLKDWFETQAEISRDELISLQAKLDKSGEKLTYTLCNFMMKWMIDFADRQIKK